VQWKLRHMSQFPGQDSVLNTPRPRKRVNFPEVGPRNTQARGAFGCPTGWPGLDHPTPPSHWRFAVGLPLVSDTDETLVVPMFWKVLSMSGSQEGIKSAL
jgi:hypothetical protein